MVSTISDGVPFYILDHWPHLRNGPKVANFEPKPPLLVIMGHGGSWWLANVDQMVDHSGTHVGWCRVKKTNCKLQFPQPYYFPRHSPDFRTVLESWLDHFPLATYQNVRCKQRSKQTNKQTKTDNFNIPNQIWNIVAPITVFCFIHFVVKSFVFCKTWIFWVT